METTMASYIELQNQIAELQRAAEEVRAKELEGAIEQITKLMQEYGLSIDDISGSGKKRDGGQKRSSKAKAVKAVQFQDKEGNTWSGRGRIPGWLQGKDKEQYRVT